ncbi:hypothetical protein F1559_001201 [Cyanidiococcus yangmingshanensis]|uniref:Uncharacterized protein n=1 Tax=Cyanidiococcus yangmingshanensis TaxID=2690220 RepID=A0A7J7IIK7_9RHOD|nr:hypothetical protein F1559_001201 [Cyanidiococcus yangmingshanensis]
MCLRQGAGNAALGPSSPSSLSSLDRAAFAAKSDTIPVQVLLTQLGRLLEHNVNGLDHWALPLLRQLRQIRASTQPPDEHCAQLMRQITRKAFASTAPLIAQLIFVQNMTLRERSEWLSLISESVTDLVQTRYVAPKSAPMSLAAPSSNALTKRVGGYTRRLSIRSLLLAHRREANQLPGPGHDQGAHDTALGSNVESKALVDAITRVFFELMARSDTNEAWLDLRRRDQRLLAQLLQTASLLLYSAQGPASVCVGAPARLVSMSQTLAEVAYGARTCTDVAVHRAVALALRCVGEVLGQVIQLYSIRSVHELAQLWESDNGGCVVSLVQMMDLLARWSKDEPDEATRHAASAGMAVFWQPLY